MQLGSIDLKEKPDKRETKMFYIALVVFWLGFIKSCWLPSRQAINEAEADLETMREKRVELQAIRDKQKAEEESKTEKPKKAQASLASPGNLALSMDFLSSAQNLKGAKLMSSKFSKPQTQDNLTKQDVSLVVNGSFNSIGKYIESLEKYESPLIIENISMELEDERMGLILSEIRGSFYVKN